MIRKLVIFGAAFLLGLISAVAQSVTAAEPLELVRDGVSQFHICIPPEASPQVTAAAETLRSYLLRMSGADLPIIRAESHPGKKIAFEIGSCVNRNTITAMYGDDGFHIWTIHGSLYLTAHTARGMQNAVYTLLEDYLGCRKFSPSVEYVPSKPTIVLPAMDDTQVPLVSFRHQDLDDSAYSAWHKLSSRSEWGLFVHTFKTLVPPDKYFTDHPEYFSENNGVRTPDGQLCLTNPDVYAIVVAELGRLMKENPAARYWSVSQNDTYVPCGCADCRAFDDVEGSPAGSILGFVNLVADEFPGKTISTLAYQYSRRAPAHVKPAPNVNIMLCSIECNRSKPIAEDPGSASFVQDLRDWSRLTHNIFLWDYVIQYRNLVSPFPNLRVLQPNIQLFVENGVTSIFEQGVSSMQGEFAELRTYLIAKLLWNPYVNVDSVMNDFLRGYYGEAAPFVRQYIDTMHDALARSGEDLSCYGYPFPSDDGYLSAAMIDRYVSIFDRAEAAVAGQPEVLARVQTARLPLRYAQLEQAKLLGDAERGCFERGPDGVRTVRPEVETLLQTFVTHANRAGITKLWEYGITPDDYHAATRSFLDRSARLHLAQLRPITLTPKASTKYHGGEAGALTDGLKGWDDYHMHWLGFEGEDMDAVIDLGELHTVARIETDFLQDINSWVFMPSQVEFFTSVDGARFHPVGTVQNSLAPQAYGPRVAPFNVQFEPTQARYVRVKAHSLRICPSWHKGSGGKAWIFIDEISVL